MIAAGPPGGEACKHCGHIAAVHDHMSDLPEARQKGCRARIASGRPGGLPYCDCERFEHSGKWYEGSQWTPDTD